MSCHDVQVISKIEEQRQVHHNHSSLAGFHLFMWYRSLQTYTSFRGVVGTDDADPRQPNSVDPEVGLANPRERP